MEETQSQTQEERLADLRSYGRKSRKSIRRQLEEALVLMDAEIENKNQKPAKVADLITQRNNILLRLYEIDNQREHDELRVENENLKATAKASAEEVSHLTLLKDAHIEEQIAKDNTISRLQDENAELQERLNTRKVVRVPDSGEKEALEWLCSRVPQASRATMAVRAIQALADASVICKALDVDHGTYVRLLHEYSTKESLIALFKNAWDDVAAREFARAALAVLNHSIQDGREEPEAATIAPKVTKKETAYAPDTRPLEVKMAEADAAVKALRGPADFKSPFPYPQTSDPAPATEPSKPPAEKKWHAESFQSLPRRSYLTDFEE
jgi:hypothetical protein